MKTVTETVDRDFPSAETLARAADVIRNGGLVAFPTETVYGLGADGFQPEAVQKIYAAKDRPADNPLILHIYKKKQLEDIAAEISETTHQLIERFWPGPLTLVVKKRPEVPGYASAGLDTVSVRLPLGVIARQLIKLSGTCIAAPSANTSGRPSPTRAAHVAHDMDGKIDMILDGGPADFGLESTILDVSGARPVLLRPGAVTWEMLEQTVGPVDIDPAVLHEPQDTKRPRSPGMTYTHYAPLAKVTVVTGEVSHIAEKIKLLAAAAGKKTGILATEQTMRYYADIPSTAGSILVLVSGDRDRPSTIAEGLFDNLRRFDLHGVDEVYAEGLHEEGIGMAIMNRLKRAAGYRIIEV